MTACVLDASVAAKWFLPPAGEALTTEAKQVFEDYAGGRLRVMVPDLFWPEIGNIFWKAARQRRISRKLAEEALSAIEELGFTTSPSRPILKDAFAIAQAFDRTVYDAMYVALAIAANRPLLTADERLANTFALHFPIRWLGSL